MKTRLYIRVVVYICLFMACYTYANAQSKKVDTTPFTIGETLTFYSTNLAEERKLNIYLPQNYAPDSVQYHFIYLLDGSAEEDFIHIAGLFQFANFPWIKMAPPVIVVGIENVDRYHDFTFEADKQEFIEEYPGMGGSADFIAFLEKEVKPMVQERYPTDGTSTFIGQSLGGLLGTEILFTRPDMFSNYIIISPSLWWNDQSLFDLQEGMKAAKENHKVYVAVGKEGDIMETDARRLGSLLKEQYTDVLETDFRYFGGQDHGNILHLAVYDALKFLYPGLMEKEQ